MKHLFKGMLLLALFASASAFTTNTQTAAATVAGINKPAAANLQLKQVGPGTVLATWNGTAPFQVIVTNLDTGLREQIFQTNNQFAVINNLTANTNYRVTVGDINLVFADIFVN